MDVTIDANGNGLAGSLTIDAVSQTGNPTGTQSSTLQATRIPAGPAGTPAA